MPSELGNANRRVGSNLSDAPATGGTPALKPARSMKTLVEEYARPKLSLEATDGAADTFARGEGLGGRVAERARTAHAEAALAAVQNPFGGSVGGSLATLATPAHDEEGASANFAKASADVGDVASFVATRFSTTANITGLVTGPDDSLSVGQDISSLSLSGLHREALGNATLLVGGGALARVGTGGLQAAAGAKFGSLTLLPSATVAAVTYHRAEPLEERKLSGDHTVVQLMRIKSQAQLVFVASLQVSEAAASVGGGLRLSLSHGKEIVYHKFMPVAEADQHLQRQSRWWSALREPLQAFGLSAGLPTLDVRKVATAGTLSEALEVGEMVTWTTNRALTFGAAVGAAGVRGGLVVSSAHAHHLKLERVGEATMRLTVETGRNSAVRGQVEAPMVAEGSAAVVFTHGLSRQFAFDLGEPSAVEALRAALQGNLPAAITQAGLGSAESAERTLLGLGMAQRLPQGVSNIALERAEHVSRQVGVAGWQPLGMLKSVMGLVQQRTWYAGKRTVALPQVGAARVDHVQGSVDRRELLWRGGREMGVEGIAHVGTSHSHEHGFERTFEGLTIRAWFDFSRMRRHNMVDLAQRIQQISDISVVAPPTVPVSRAYEMKLSRTISGEQLTQLAATEPAVIADAASAVALSERTVAGLVGDLARVAGGDGVEANIARAEVLSAFLARHRCRGFGAVQRMVSTDAAADLEVELVSRALDDALAKLEDWRLAELSDGHVDPHRLLKKLESKVIPRLEGARLALTNDTIVRALDPDLAGSMAESLTGTHERVTKEAAALRDKLAQSAEPRKKGLRTAIAREVSRALDRLPTNTKTSGRRGRSGR